MTVSCWTGMTTFSGMILTVEPSSLMRSTLLLHAKYESNLFQSNEAFYTK